MHRDGIESGGRLPQCTGERNGLVRLSLKRHGRLVTINTGANVAGERSVRLDAMEDAILNAIDAGGYDLPIRIGCFWHRFLAFSDESLKGVLSSAQEENELLKTSHSDTPMGILFRTQQRDKI